MAVSSRPTRRWGDVVIIFSDLHLEPKSRATCMEVLRRIPELCAKHNDRHVAFLGDWWMVRHTLVVKLLLECRDVLRSWEGAVDRFDVLVGNHDQIDNAGRNALEVFDGLPFETVVHTNPGWTSAGFWLPYRNTHEDQRAALAHAAATQDGQPSVLFAHMGVSGAMMNNTHADTTGLEASEVKGAFKRVFLGHYHRHHLVRKGMLYVGSPYQVSYAEAGQAKGYVHWDGTAPVFHEFAPVIGVRHHKIEIDADHPTDISVGEIGENDRLWVLVKGTTAGVMRDVVSSQLEQAGIDVARLEVDMQPSTAAARIQRERGEALGDLALRFVDAQEIEPNMKEMLAAAWARIAS